MKEILELLVALVILAAPALGTIFFWVILVPATVVILSAPFKK